LKSAKVIQRQEYVNELKWNTGGMTLKICPSAT
jgi:hypothetical protein